MSFVDIFTFPNTSGYKIIWDTAAPSSRAGGEPLQAGDIWIDTTNYVSKVYNGSSWIAGDGSFDDIASTGTATFTGTKATAINISGAYTTQGILISKAPLQGIVVGTFHSTVASNGTKIGASGSTTGANRFYTDDGGSAISAGGSVPDVRGVLARTLVTADNTANHMRLFPLMGHLKAYNGKWNGEQIGATAGFLELVKNSTTFTFTLGGYGITSGLMSTVETSGTMTVDTNHALCGVAAVSKMTSDLTQTGVTAAFYAGIYDVTNWSDGTARSTWKYGLYIANSSVAAGGDIRLSSGATISTGTGVPGHAAIQGSLYIRTGQSVSATLYLNSTGSSAWVLLSGVT